LGQRAGRGPIRTIEVVEFLAQEMVLAVSIAPAIRPYRSLSAINVLGLETGFSCAVRLRSEKAGFLNADEHR
jgi:hypothetical protein